MDAEGARERLVERWMSKMGARGHLWDAKRASGGAAGSARERLEQLRGALGVPPGYLGDALGSVRVPQGHPHSDFSLPLVLIDSSGRLGGTLKRLEVALGDAKTESKWTRKGSRGPWVRKGGGKVDAEGARGRLVERWMSKTGARGRLGDAKRVPGGAVESARGCLEEPRGASGVPRGCLGERRGPSGTSHQTFFATICFC